MIIYIIVFGLAIGSFANALAWRIKYDMNYMNDRSVCEHCDHVLAWKDLVPLLSWLSLKGKCRYCSKPVSIKHPIIEVLTATAYGLSYAFWPIELAGTSSVGQFSIWLAILAILVALLIYDLNWLELPDKLMRALAVVVTIGVLFAVLVSTTPTDTIKDSVMGLVIGGGIFYLLYQVSDGKWIGGGDVKLGFVMGLYVGALNAFVALVLAFYSATLFILPLMITKKLTRKSKVPFGPFLILGFYAVTIWGEKLSEWLQNWLGV